VTGWARLALVLLFLTLAPTGAGAAEAKRVLIVHSFGSTAPPFTTHSTAFQTTLTKEMGERVDMDEVSLDMARYAQPDMEGAFVEFLLARLTKWRPDLVVPIGSPAGRFVAKYRHRLFPRAPILYTGMDRRTLPDNALADNATFVGESFDIAGLVEDILQLAPDTEHIAVVIGASPLERFWTKAFQEAFQPFTSRVRFTWFNDLSFDEMLRQAATLPPRSFILLALLLRDASGVTHNQDDALQQLRAVANAPINGLYRNQLGLGLVGGRLYQAEAEGDESARVAVRVLRGEPISTFPPRIIGTEQHPRYDWRELQRWKIPEARLPAGSLVEFRQPTVWERYRWWIAGVVAIGLLQAALIVQLGSNLVKRRRVERALRESEERFRTVADSAPVFIWMAGVDKRYTFFNKPWLDFTGRTLAQETGTGWIEGVHPDDVEAYLKDSGEAFDARRAFLLFYRLRRHDGEYRWISAHGVPRLDAIGRFAGYIGSCSDVTERRRAEAETQSLRTELAHMSRVATMGELTAAIVHELSQPLTAILSNAQAGLRFTGAGDEGQAHVREILADIVADDLRARQVIQNMRALFQKHTEERRPQALNALINDVASMVVTDALLRHVSLALQLADELPAVSGDRVQLQQVVLNLVMNAFDAVSETPGRPRSVRVRTRSLDGRAVQVDVIDTGPGIAPDTLLTIFEPFVTTKRTGMGMGLSVSRSIVVAHDGKIWAENNAEGGATVSLVLPAIHG
jgi:PAS domain S-box-containing protein